MTARPFHWNAVFCGITVAVVGFAPMTLILGADSRPEEGAEVIVRTVGESPVAARLVSFSLGDGLVVRPANQGERRFDFDDVVSVSAVGFEASAAGRDMILSLNNGDAVVGRLVEAPIDQIAVETNDAGRLVFPLDSLERLTSPAAARQESVRWLDRSPGEDDRVLLTNGDIVRGFLVAVGPDGATIRTHTGETTVPLRLLATAHLAGSEPVAPLSHGVILTLRATGRLTCTEFDWAGKQLRATLVHRQEVRVEAARVVRVDVLGGRWEWLDRRAPTDAEQTPMLALAWDWQANRNAQGGPLRVAGAIFDHGLGVHSRSRLTYSLNGAYREFVTHFGLDDDSGAFADVDVTIIIDDRPRFAQTGIRRGTLVGPVRLDITGAKQLQLIVDFGQNGDIQDRFDWIEPALVR